MVANPSPVCVCGTHLFRESRIGFSSVPLRFFFSETEGASQALSVLSVFSMGLFFLAKVKAERSFSEKRRLGVFLFRDEVGFFICFNVWWGGWIGMIS